ERRAGNRLTIKLEGAAVSSSLYNRRFIVGEGGLLKRIGVSESAGGVATQIDIDVSSINDYSAFRLSDPERIVIDIHADGAMPRNSAHGNSVLASTHPTACSRPAAASTRIASHDV